MHLNISGFLKDSSEDDSLKFRYGFGSSLNELILNIMNWDSLDSSPDGRTELSTEQIRQIKEVSGLRFPSDLKFYISVRSGVPINTQ